MKYVKAAIAVVVAPLVGAIVWFGQMIVRSEVMASQFQDPSFSMLKALGRDQLGALQLIGVGWLSGLVLTVIVGLPIGFLVAFIMRKFTLEGFAQYLAAGAAASFLLAMTLPGRDEFWLPILVTGTTLGAAYWRFVRNPFPARGEGPSGSPPHV